MKLHNSKNIFLLIILIGLFFSCASRKDLAYLQDLDNSKNSDATIIYEPKLQPDDLLSIIVSAENPEVTIPFNLPKVQGNYEVDDSKQSLKTYLIDNFGFIEFPVIGKVKLGGLTRTEAIKILVSKVSEYVINPSINFRILNFKISVLGEVVRPGSYVIQGERITILEALSLAGDLSIFGKRDNILIIRESEGKKTYNRIDITNSSFINSPNYYLTQNDIIVVEPNKTKINTSAFSQNTAVILSGMSILVSLFLILYTNKNK